MERIKNVQPLVFSALVYNPATRKDDFLLVLDVYKNIINPDTGLEFAFTNHKALGLPSFASIIRIRRKLQREYPELANAGTVAMRAGAEEDYKNYALNN